MYSVKKCEYGVVEGGFMPECYVTKRGYQFEYDKPLYRGWGGSKSPFCPLRTFE